MRVDDLFIVETQQLDEINMSPRSLRQLSSVIDARAGMEFEMIVPNAESDDEGELEPDMDYDERVVDISDIGHFFEDGDYNDARTIRRFLETLREEYQTWVFDEASDAFSRNSEGYITIHLRENATDSDIAEILEREPDDEDWVAGPKDYDEAAEKVAQDSSNTWYEEAYSAFTDDYINDDHEEEWLRSEGIRYMSDVSDNYSQVSWPHYTSVGGEGRSIDEVADSFSQAIGKPINASKSYHGARREAGHYVVEPDGSLSGDNPGDSGLEFVSPPLPVTELMSDLQKVKEWADANSCYTNDSTGLHINVSVPGLKGIAENFDYVKLALLLGDENVLKKFGRDGNTYCKSAIEIVKQRVGERPEDAEALLTQMKGHLSDMASKAVHSGITNKFTSINTKEGYVEFRSPGGDWLGDNFELIEPTLLRFVVALDAAVDPNKYRQEYLTKLYKILVPKSKDDTITYFAKFAAGELPKAALKSFVRQAQLERKNVKDTYKELEPSVGTDELKWYDVKDDSGYTAMFQARNVNAAMQAAREQMPNRFPNIVNVVINDRANAALAPSPTAQQRHYEIVNNDTGQIAVGFLAADDDAAMERVEQYRRTHTDAFYRVRRAASQQTPIPGSTIDLQQQRAAAQQAQQPEAEPEAEPEPNVFQEWEVYKRDTDLAVFKFSAGSQDQAWNVGRNWASQMRRNDPSFRPDDYSVRLATAS